MRFRSGWKGKAALTGGLALWLAALAGGSWRLVRYSLAPGPAGELHGVWPAALPFAPDPAKSTLVVCLHPECGCSAATLEEVARIAAACQGRLRTIAVFEEYATLPGPIEASPRWRQAGKIPGLELWKDEDGRMALALGARTSGDVRLYDGEGRLEFAGGVTAARGHAGANPCSDAVIERVLGGGNPAVRSAPVFGCLLHEESP